MQKDITLSDYVFFIVHAAYSKQESIVVSIHFGSFFRNIKRKTVKNLPQTGCFEKKCFMALWYNIQT